MKTQLKFIKSLSLLFVFLYNLAWAGEDCEPVVISGPTEVCLQSTASFSVDKSSFVGYTTWGMYHPDGTTTYDLTEGANYTIVNYKFTTPGTYILTFVSYLENSTCGQITINVSSPATTPITITSQGNLTGCSYQNVIKLVSPFANNNQWYVYIPQAGVTQKLSNNYNINGTDGSIYGTNGQVLSLDGTTFNSNGNFFVVNTSCGTRTSNQIQVALKPGAQKPSISGMFQLCNSNKTYKGTLTASLSNSHTQWKATTIYAYTTSSGTDVYTSPGEGGILGTGTTLSQVTAGTYYAVNIYPNGCNNRSNDYPILINNSCRQGQEETTEFTGFSLSPNPSNSIVNINMPTGDFANVQIISTNGILVKEFQTSQITTELNVSDMSSGLYLMNINQNGVTTRKKFQVIK